VAPEISFVKVFADAFFSDVSSRGSSTSAATPRLIAVVASTAPTIRPRSPKALQRSRASSMGSYPVPSL
jgi:hypothetical protein